MKQSNKKKKKGGVGIILSIALGCILVLLLILLVVSNKDKNTGSKSNSTNSELIEEESAEADDKTDSENLEKGIKEDTEKSDEEKVSDGENSDSVSEETLIPDAFQGGTGEGVVVGTTIAGQEGGGESIDAPPGTEKTEDPEKQPLSLPYSIPNTNLVVTNIAGFNGSFIEDGSDVIGNNIATLVVTNNGSSCIEYANITVDQGDKTMNFTLSTIGRGETVAVMEEKMASCTSQTAYTISAAVSEISSFEMSSGKVSVTENEDGSLIVENVSGQDIPCVRVFYKFYMPDVQAYVGGITFTSKIDDLAAGTNQVISPSHYVKGNSRVVMVKTYNTK